MSSLVPLAASSAGITTATSHRHHRFLEGRVRGLGIYGAVLGGILGIFIYTRIAKLNLWEWLDIAVPGLLLGQAIGRWGNFINQELYGPPTDLPWGIKIDCAHRFGDFCARPWAPCR